jgi:hypothetical protein
LANVIYSIEVDAVDPVFFAVVPDCFMNRASGAAAQVRELSDADGWPADQDMPLVSPNDRWSF